MTTGDVVYSLRFSLIKILPEPGFDLGSTAGESCVLTARLHMLLEYIVTIILSIISSTPYCSTFVAMGGCLVGCYDSNQSYSFATQYHSHVCQTLRIIIYFPFLF